MKMIQRLVRKAAFKFQAFSQKQKKTLTWWCNDSPVKDMQGIIADGAIRSGKTVSMATSFIIWAMTNFDNQNFAMCGKTIGSFRRNVWFWLKLILMCRGYTVNEIRNENLVVISKGSASNYFYIFGGKDERSQDLIQGLTLAGVFFDEVALMPESFVNQATGRCSVEGSKFWFNCNPDSPMHWFKLNWIDKIKEKKLLHLHFTMEDNLSLSSSIIKRYRAMYFGVFFKRFILGLWVMAEGAIYDMWDDVANTFTDDDIQGVLKHKIRRSIAIDYGTTNPMVFLDIWDDGHTIWVVNEYYWSSKEKGQQKTDSMYGDDLITFIGDEVAVEDIILDPSAASFKAELRQRGLRVKEADNAVEDGIRNTATMIGKRYLRVHKHNCPMTQKEILSYIWDDKKKERGKEEPLKQFDHSCDALRYYIKTKIKAWRLAA